MKKILLMAFFVGMTITVFAQNENKYSPSTQMFLSEQLGETKLPKLGEKQLMIDEKAGSPQIFIDERQKKAYKTRQIAEAEMVNGVKMISAFIAVKNDDFSGLESLGVVIEAKFKDLATTLIPVDKIEAVAALDNVTRIEVAEILQPLTDRQRDVTKAIDAITNSAAAQSLGITSPYTGKGVILGIIDTGIDFQHLAFKDKNGNTRIKRAYKLQSATSTSLTTYSTTEQINGLTYDTRNEDHGTHTSSTAGGSSVIVNGNTVTVTDDHANATYGGMAPEADLVIAGLSSLYTTSIGTAIQNICNYADQQGKPCVISLSLGSQVGPHDGTGSIASIVNQYAGNNHIIVYAASNDAMRADYFVQAGTSTGGGCYASATSTNSKTMLVNLQKAYTDADGNIQLLNPTFHAYARTPNTAISLKFRVVDTTTGDVVYSSNAYNTSTTIDMTGTTGLAQYFKSSASYYNNYGDAGKIRILRGLDDYSGKYYFSVYCPRLTSTSYDDSDGDGVYNSKYALCVSVYPTSGSTIIDMWESSQVSWFGNNLKLSSTYANSYTIANGNDDCSVSDNACYNKVISVGAYVSKNQTTDYAGNTYYFTEDYPNIGDHAFFSSWQTAGYGPLGTALPTINAPGARVVSAINHYHTASVDDYSYYGDKFKSDLVVNNTTYPYAAMEGTSMATPCVSGIIAQWLQACVEAGKTPSPDYIKEVMAATWDTDEWTNGTGNGAHGAKTFGTHGKINAIKGIQYILGVTGGPTIIATPETIDFGTVAKGSTTTKTFNVKGLNLKGNITATLSGNAYSISTTNVSVAEATDGKDITVTFSPTANGTLTGTVTLTSSEAENVVVNLTGKAVTPTLTVEPQALDFNYFAGQETSQTFNVKGTDLLGDVTLELTDANNVFSITPVTVSKAEATATNGKDITVTFKPNTTGSFAGTVTLKSESAEDVNVALNGVAAEGSYDVTISSYGVTTLYLDFPVAIPYATYRDLLGVYIAYSMKGNEMRLARLRDNIPANTGVVVQGNKGTYTFQRIVEASPLKYDNLLLGTTTPISVDEALAGHDGSIVMTLGQGSNGYIGFYKYNGTTLGANKAYFIYDGSNGAKGLILSTEDENGETTGINVVDADADGNNVWYNLQGQRLTSRPVKSGVYIRNGKAIVVK